MRLLEAIANPTRARIWAQVAIFLPVLVSAFDSCGSRQVAVRRVFALVTALHKKGFVPDDVMVEALPMLEQLAAELGSVGNPGE